MPKPSTKISRKKATQWKAGRAKARAAAMDAATAPTETLETDNGTHGTVVLRVSFTCERELHDLEDFQRGGHFVPGMVDSMGTRRDWQGSQVHVLMLKWAGHQVLRVLADSAEEAERLMKSRIEEDFFANWKSTTITQTVSADLADYRRREHDLLEHIRQLFGKRHDANFGDNGFEIAKSILSKASNGEKL
jgi:hypothetical protein